MPRIYKSARGDTVNFDAVLIKQQLAQAPMNIEVARRKNFIDSKEEKPRRVNVTAPIAPAPEVAAAQAPAKPADFEVEAAPAAVKKAAPSEEGPVPNIPKR